MSPAKEHARSLLWLSLLGAVICVFCLHVGRAWDYSADDATVSWAYARNLTGGHGLVLTPGAERVEASPSLLWVLLLTLATPLHLSHAALSKGLGLLFGAGALVAVAYLPAAVYRRRPRGFDLVAPALAATFAHVAQWTASGTESGLVAFATALTVVAFAWEENHPERLPWSAVAGSVAFAARPDAALVLVALGLVKTARALRRGMNRQDVLWGILLTLGLSAQELFRLAYFAEALPNGFRVRLDTRDHGHLSGFAYLRAWVSTYRLGALTALAPVALLSTREPFTRAALALACAAGLATPFVFGGDPADEWRLLAPVTPLLCALVAEALRVLLRAPLGLLTPERRRFAAPVLAALAAWFAVREATGAWTARFEVLRIRTISASTQPPARCLDVAARALGGARTSVLTTDVGALVDDDALDLVDLSGLADAAVARARRTSPTALREVVFGERRPTLVHLRAGSDATTTLDVDALRGMYLPLPPSLDGAPCEGVNLLRRDALAAPWSELTDALPTEDAPTPDRATVASSAVSPGEKLTVLLSFVRAAELPPDGEVLAVPDGDGTEARSAAVPGAGLLDVAELLAGERPIARVQLALRPGRYRLRWRAGTREVELGSVHVSDGAGARASTLAAAMLTRALELGHVADARRIALRLELRLRDVPDDEAARGALDRYGRALATLASRLGERDAFTVAAEVAREARRFTRGDLETHDLLRRLVERMADASRRAPDAAAFTLARDAVLLDARRSWMRRRAESLRAHRRSEHDGAREVRAYEAACDALATDATTATRDRVLTALGAEGRFIEAVAWAERAGHRPESAAARAVLARGRLARGEATAVMMDATETQDAALREALAALGHRAR